MADARAACTRDGEGCLHGRRPARARRRDRVQRPAGEPAISGRPGAALRARQGLSGRQARRGCRHDRDGAGDLRRAVEGRPRVSANDSPRGGSVAPLASSWRIVIHSAGQGSIGEWNAMTTTKKPAKKSGAKKTARKSGAKKSAKKSPGKKTAKKNGGGGGRPPGGQRV